MLMKKLLTGREWLDSEYRQKRDRRKAITYLSLFSPILTSAAGFKYIEDFYPPLYYQERVGKNGQPFIIKKIRTMPVNTEVCSSAGPADNRSTLIGKLLRLSSLDESPQFLNVISGDMSIIGPRPIIKEEFDVIKAAFDDVKPTDISYQQWEDSYYSQRPGILSTSAMFARLHDPTSPHSAINRARHDIHDAQCASLANEKRIASVFICSRTIGLGAGPGIWKPLST